MLLAFDDIGPGPVVVLIHGFPLNRSMWEAQTAEVGSIYRLITPDLRGHGETARPDGVYTIDLMADDVLELLDALNLDEPVVIGGHSMGGYIALSLACRYPDRFRGLMLFNTRATPDTPSTAEGRESLARAVEAADKPDPVVDAMLPKLFSPATLANEPQVVFRTRDQMLRSAPTSLASTLRGLAIRPDRTQSLAAINMPTLVIAGADDVIIPMDESNQMANAIPGAQVVVVSNAGHLASLENKTVVNAAILNFLKSLPQGRSTIRTL